MSKEQKRFGIFLSSTNDRFTREYRLRAREIIENEFKHRWYVEEMSDFTPENAPPLDACERKVKECHVYIGMFGAFYGSVNDQVNMSYTEYEYTVARDNNKLIGVFLLPLAPKDPTNDEMSRLMAGGARQNDFRNRVGSAHLGRMIENMADFEYYLRVFISTLEHPKEAAPHHTIVETVPFLGGDDIDPYDYRPVLQHSIDDLDSELISQMIQTPLAQGELLRLNLQRTTLSEQLVALGVLRQVGDKVYPTYGAFLCFGKRSKLRMFPFCTLHLSVYDGIDKGKSSSLLLSERTENLFTLFDVGMDFFFNQARLRRYGKIGSADRDDLEVPSLALREALSNALIHREYFEAPTKEQPTRLEVFADRVEITSYGNLMAGLSADLLNTDPKNIPQLRRNRVITRLFQLAALAELRASGISRMHEEMEKRGEGMFKPRVITSPPGSVPWVKVVFLRPAGSDARLDIEVAEAVQQRRSTASGRARIDVMISSNSLDLPEHRKEAIDALLRSGMFPLALEPLAAQGSNALTVALKLVDEAEIYVGIIGFRYGYVPDDPVRNPDRLSITELEYRRALERGIPILIFFMSDDHPVPTRRADEPERYFESTEEGQKRIKGFREELGKRHVVGFFRSPQELRADIIQLLRASEVIDRALKFAVENGIPAVETGIPAPPKLYAVPPYTLTSTFVGRAAELAELSAWSKSNEPIMVYEAIGGMGKSALTWEWVQRLFHDGHDFKGIFWYSFNEGGSLMHSFLRHAVAYMTQQDPDKLKTETHDDLAAKLLTELNLGRWLLVLDGVERLLVAYHRIDAAQVREDEVRRDLRDCTSPKDNRLLQQLAGVNPSKLLISTRLMPRAFEDAGTPVQGVRLRKLWGLLPPDALDLMQDRGVTWDDERELDHFMQQIGYHGLLLKVIAGRIKTHRRARGHFDTWYAIDGKDLNLYQLTDQHRRTHILAYAFEGLGEDKRLLLSQIAAFGDPVDYETVSLFNPYDDPSEFDSMLTELEDRGLLQWDRDADTYDLHPVVRGYSFSQLQDRIGTFGRIVDYFKKKPIEPYIEVESLDDLRVSLTIYRALVGAGRLDEAVGFFRGSFANALFFNLGAYATVIELLAPLFSDGVEVLPSVNNESDIRYILNAFAISLLNIGNTRAALSHFIRIYKLDLERGDIGELFIGLGNYADTLKNLNQLAQSYRAQNLCRELVSTIGDERQTTNAVYGLLELDILRGNLDAAAAIEARLSGDEDDAYSLLLRARLRFYQRKDARPLLETGLQNAQKDHWLKGQMLLHALRAELELAGDNFTLADAALEQALTIARRSGAYEQARYMALLAEIRTAQGDTQRETLIALDLIKEAFDLTMIEFDKAAVFNSAARVYYSMGNQDKAQEYALQAYQVAWADGEPYSQWYELKRARAMLGILNLPEPKLPPFDPAKVEPIPYEDEIKALIGKS